MKNIDKYVKNTKWKTKKAKLPALSTMNPVVLPDGAAGIATFNSSFGEDISNEVIDNLNKKLTTNITEFLLDKGFEKEQLDDLFNIDFDEYDDNKLSIIINADLTISSLRELADVLYPVIEKYDEDAYFDIATNDSISTELEIPMNLTEKLHDLDKKGFELHSKDYGFEPLYEAMKDKLDSEDRQKLKNFISTTDDPEKVNIFMKGLLMEEETQLTEDVELDEGETVSSLVNRLIDDMETIRGEVNGIITTANKHGLDVLRNSADLAIGALDDFIKYMEDVKDAADEEEIVETEEPIEEFEDEEAIEESLSLKEWYDSDPINTYWRDQIGTNDETILDTALDCNNAYVEEEDGHYTFCALGGDDMEFDNKEDMIDVLAYSLDEMEESFEDQFVGRFHEYYPTSIEFKDATGLEYTKENIKNIISDWAANEEVINDILDATDRIATIAADVIIGDVLDVLNEAHSPIDDENIVNKLIQIMTQYVDEFYKEVTTKCRLPRKGITARFSTSTIYSSEFYMDYSCLYPTYSKENAKTALNIFKKYATTIMTYLDTLKFKYPDLEYQIDKTIVSSSRIGKGLYVYNFPFDLPDKYYSLPEEE